MFARKPLSPSNVSPVGGWLEVGDGHRLHFEDCGPRDAPAVLLLHGGPGSSASARQRDWLDATRWRIVQFDQRGCGLSTPLGGLVSNHIDALVADMETLRMHLGIDSWAIGAGSWGATLALIYASRHRAQVQALVLRGVFLADRGDLDWFFQGVGALAPDAHAEFMAAIPRRWRSRAVHYLAMRLADKITPTVFSGPARLLADPPAPDGASCKAPSNRMRIRALALAQACQRYELALDGVAGEEPPAISDATDAQRRVARCRVQMHYLANGCFLDEGAVLRAASTLHDVPIAIVHGEQDLICRPSNARALQRASPDAHLAWAYGARHSPFHPATAALLREAGECLRRDGHFKAWPSPKRGAAA